MVYQMMQSSQISRIQRREQRLKPATLREFDGGLNVVDTDLNLSTRFAKEFKNYYINADGSVALRYGTRLFSSLVGVMTAGAVINYMIYFQDHLIVFNNFGEVIKVNGAGVATRIWDNTIASGLVGSPLGWGITVVVSCTVFDGKLVACNGINKPLVIDLNNANPVQYLVDAGTGSNINTPICKYVTTINSYVVMAGDPLNPDRVHISAKGAIGTFFGDPAPNDATFLDLGKVIASPNQVIKGIARYREKLAIAFEDNIVLSILGIYNDSGVHIPDSSDVIEQHGALSHFTMLALGNDLLMADNVGVLSLERAFVTSAVDAKRESDLIAPRLQGNINKYSIAGLESSTWALYDKKAKMYFLFLPYDPAIDETACFVYDRNPTSSKRRWSEFVGWNFRFGCVSNLGRVFLANGANIHVYGTQEDPIYADYVGTNVLVDGALTTEGVPISFDWEIPWIDFDKRMSIKHSRYISVEAKGTSQFTLQMFVDNLYKDRFTEEYTPELEIVFLGGDTSGFGDADQPYGGGRKLLDEQLWAWPAKFKIAKLRLTGASRQPLQIVSISLMYLEGGIRR
jgi:hypothetical protein